MRLQNQLTIAFTSLLIVVMAITGITIYSQMLQMLIKDEQRQLEDKGELIVNFILSQDLNRTVNIQRLLSMLEEYNVHIFAYDEGEDRIIFTSISDLIIMIYVVENSRYGRQRVKSLLFRYFRFIHRSPPNNSFY